MQTVSLIALVPGLCLSLVVVPKDNQEAKTIPAGMLESVSSGMAHQRSIMEPKQFLDAMRQYRFADFVHEFGRPYKRDTPEWNRREKVFNENKMAVIDFHLGPRRSWRLGVTEFMDYTPEEFKRLLGYKPSRGPGTTVHAPAVSIVRTQAVAETVVNAVNESGLSGFIRNQGSCGSCWAMAATSTLEAHMERNSDVMLTVNQRQSPGDGLPTLSSQTILSCTANPRHCGGKGGCDGATVQLAYDMVKEHGIPMSKKWNYLAMDSECKSNVFDDAVVGITGYEELPKNQLEPMKRAVVQQGPVAVAVAASDWNFYIDGIMSDSDSEDKNKFLLNHAVVLIGYNSEKGPKHNYWLIKNSWGRGWGENGNIRLEMKPDEGRHCGWDEDTHVGMACDGDANRDWACGTFGVLYNGVIPKGVHLKQPSLR